MATSKKQTVNKIAGTQIATSTRTEIAEKKEGVKKNDSSKNKVTMKEDTTAKKYEEINFVDSTKPVWNYSLLTEEDIRNFQNGTLYNGYELFGDRKSVV